VLSAAADAGWLLDAADLLAEPDPGPTPWLVDGLIVDRALVAAVGRWKTTKSYGLLDVCVSIATGRPAFGRLGIPTPGPVVFINEESGRAALWRRLDSLCRGRAIDPEELRGRLHVAANARIRLDDPDWQQRLIEIGQELQPRLFVFDPLARMKASARDESAQKEMAAVVEFWRRLRDDTGAAVALVHHTGHAGEQMRGTSDLETVWETRLTWKRDGDAAVVDLEASHREAEAMPTLHYRLNWHAETRTMRLDTIEEPSAPTLADRLLQTLEHHGPGTTDELRERVGVRRADVLRTLEQLQQAGRITFGPSGKRDSLGRTTREKVWKPRTHAGLWPSQIPDGSGRITSDGPTSDRDPSRRPPPLGGTRTDGSREAPDDDEIERLAALAQETGWDDDDAEPQPGRPGLASVQRGNGNGAVHPADAAREAAR
jgi:hypothetical protein